MTSLNDLGQLQKKDIIAWQVGASSEKKLRFEYNGNVHSISKFTVVANLALEFSILCEVLTGIEHLSNHANRVWLLSMYKASCHVFPSLSMISHHSP